MPRALLACLTAPAALAALASLASAAALALLLTAVPACSTPCDSDRICSLDGQGQVCDGQSFVACGSDNAGQRLLCGNAHRVAVCTPGGWTIQTSP